MSRWYEFRDSSFSLVFKYPESTPEGSTVEQTESSSGDLARVHFVSRDSGELYFEITKYRDLHPEQEYEQHSAALRKRFAKMSITDLQVSDWNSLVAYEYSFAWDQGVRSVILIERGDGLYRILYDPRSVLNVRLLSTVEWTD